MSVKSVLHKLIDELNRPHLHDEVDAPEEASKEETTDAEES
jgi:hypothetical protein